MSKLQQYLNQHPFFIKLLHWEYWSFNVVYAPMYLVYLLFGIRARSFFFFAAANPTIKNGGFLMETKSEIDPLIPNQYKAATLLFNVGTLAETVIAGINEKNITYPLIIKPDNGARGRGVRKVNNEHELREVLPLYTVDYVVQNYIPYPKEMGLFYVRMPNEAKGKVTGIVGKEFLQVTGDGTSNVLQLLQQNKRYILQLPVLKKILSNQLDIVLPAGQTQVLLPYGNHARGCLFLDLSYLIDDQLTEQMNKVCTQIDGFYYGRMDIRYNTWEELLQGKNFSIIELNGAGADPTHIYDPNHSIFFAWKEIIRHWVYLYKIAAINHKKGHRYLTTREGLQMFKENAAYDKVLNALVV